MQIVEHLPALRPRAGRWLRVVSRHQPWVVLVPLLLAQWLALLAFVLTVRHNGWLFYQGGDETFYYTTSWVLSGWHIPTAPIGYGWSYLLSPLALAVGPNILGALPVIVLVNTLVLLPVATLCVYGIGTRVGGRLIGYLATLLWVIGPYAAIPFWDPRYHQKWTELFLPQALGLTGMADFPSLVCLLVGAYFCFRALDSDSWREGVAAGLAIGFAIGMKPANGLFVAAPVVAFLLARRWRQGLAIAAAAVPALIALWVWKQRSLGFATVTSLGIPHLAYAGLPVEPLAFTGSITKNAHVDWHRLGQNMDALREFFWSVRPLEYLPIAGAIAVLFRSLPKGAFLGLWFFAFFLVKGSSAQASVEDGSFFRLLMPALPAYLLLTASVPLLVPTYGERLATRFAAPAPRTPAPRRLATAAAVFALVPLLVVTAAPTLRSATAVKFFDEGLFLPIDGGFRASGTVSARSVTLRWPARGGAGARTFYRVLRAPASQPDPVTSANPPWVRGVKCQYKSSSTAADCALEGATQVGQTWNRTFVDHPGRGRWSYYVAMTSNWLADPTLGDILLLSSPVTVTVAG